MATLLRGRRDGRRCVGADGLGVEERPAGLVQSAVRAAGGGERIGQPPKPVADVVSASVDQAVGVEREDAARFELDRRGLVRHAADGEGRPREKVDGFGGPVGPDQHGRRSPGTGHGAVSGDRVVDRVQAGGAHDVVIAGRRFRRETLDQVGDPGEQFVRFRFEVGEGLDGGAQTAHGGTGGYAAADHVSCDEGQPERGQGYGVVPVASGARATACGQVDAGGLGCRSAGRGRGKESLLQGHGRSVLARVATGVVDGERSP